MHFFTKRRDILSTMLETGKHDDAIPALMAPVEADRERFAELRQEVEEFWRWAADGLHELNQLYSD